jgi:outer membrane receptor protein involved in Fe transport
VVITREDLESYGSLSLGEILERRAGVQLRTTGGAGQPQGVFIRGAGTAQTLFLVDGLRVSSATVGSTSIESIPVEMIERVEVVKGPLSSLYGSEAIGGVGADIHAGQVRAAPLRRARVRNGQRRARLGGRGRRRRAQRLLALDGRPQGGLRRARPTRAPSATTRTAIRTTMRSRTSTPRTGCGRASSSRSTRSLRAIARRSTAAAPTTATTTR